MGVGVDTETQQKNDRKRQKMIIFGSKLKAEEIRVNRSMTDKLGTKLIHSIASKVDIGDGADGLGVS